MIAPYLRSLASFVLAGSLLAPGCAQGGSGSRPDAGVPSGFDAGTTDAGTAPPSEDAGAPIGFDASPPGLDAGAETGTDASVGLIDSGVDASVGLIDSGPPMGGSLALTPGFSMTVSGSTSGGPIWHRPLAGSCPASSLSGVATAVAYETRPIHNASAGTLSVTIASTASYDGYLVIYAGTAIPSDVLMCLAGDDDSGGSGNPRVTFTLAPGQSALVVQSGFDNDDVGPYSMTITAS
ncbi:MAG: hypothetical protein KF729_30235 [Sandaracinaceae bacterium]|nr:hypothetical protein [Sandaracinaceae bacterium]